MSKTTDYFIKQEEKGFDPIKQWEREHYNPNPQAKFIEGVGIVGEIVIDKFGHTKELI